MSMAGNRFSGDSRASRVAGLWHLSLTLGVEEVSSEKAVLVRDCLRDNMQDSIIACNTRSSSS